MLMIVVALVMARVWGVVDARGCGFRGFLRETPIMGLFIIGSVPSTTPRIWLTCAPDSTTLGGNCQGGNIFLRFSYNVSSSSFESVSVEASGFFRSGPELDPSPSSLSFFLRI
jgi:hypothetical protein